jgi:hypothetical protein
MAEKAVILGVVQKIAFGQPQAEISLPKALATYLYAVFGPQVGQKLHENMILALSAE